MLAIQRYHGIAQLPSLKLPCLISGLTEHWTAHTNWHPQRLRHVPGHFDVGQPVLESMSTFLNKPSADRYLFDATVFDADSESSAMANDFQAPAIFCDDVFACLPSRYRPDYRWLLVGHAGSGSKLHIDPIYTCAWNALIHGRKTWFIAPSSTHTEHADFQTRAHELTADHAAEKWLGQYYCFDQLPGEIVYIPAGWWHAVRNSTLSVAVTQNFLPTSQVPGDLSLILDQLERAHKFTTEDDRARCKQALEMHLRASATL
jgi:histone arginine demethylase JMJD6